jgi:hypothetical protein
MRSRKHEKYQSFEISNSKIHIVSIIGCQKDTLLIAKTRGTRQICTNFSNF